MIHFKVIPKGLLGPDDTCEVYISRHEWVKGSMAWLTKHTLSARSIPQLHMEQEIFCVSMKI